MKFKFPSNQKSSALEKKGHIALFSFLGILFFIGLWYLISALTSTFLIPYPHQTFIRAIELLGISNTYSALWGSLSRILVSLSISSSLGIILGVLSGLFESFKHFMRPTISILRSLPTSAIVLILIIYTKNELTAMILVSLMITPLMYQAAQSGTEAIKKAYLFPLRLEGIYKWNSIVKVIVPLSLRFILLGIVQSIGLAMKVEVMAEIVIGNTKMTGIGVSIFRAYRDVNMVDLTANCTIIILIIIAIESLIFLLKKNVEKSI